MNRFCCLLFSAALCLSGFSQKTAIRLIVRGDDMGYTHSGNLALIQSYAKGIEKSIEVIVPSPWFPEAVRLLKQNPGVDVGVHLCLSSEWENIKWRPLTVCPSLQNENGYFFPMIYPNKNYPGQSLSEHHGNIQEIENELRAQILLAMKNIPGISHVSAHMGCTSISPEVKAVAKRLAKEYHISIDPEEKGVISVGYPGKHETFAEKEAGFLQMLASLVPGKTYLFLDHPGLDNDELKAVYHIGYEKVAADRQGVTDLFTSEKVKAAIRKRGIELIAYKDLAQ
ncbi:MAG: polysaccharide deacetylase family protein [Bacteroidota bacterium]|nr:polysaccharide deacetylase family protein [Bacteroidota bacterium]